MTIPTTESFTGIHWSRDLQQLTQETYDVLIIGGGIYGAWALWDATNRGMKAALIEQHDFGSATSANSQRILHGGLRYLQHMDFRRMRESICERSIAMTVAPHLTKPMPFLVPTYPWSAQSKWPMRVALKLNDWISRDRNKNLPDSHHLPNGRVISKEDCLTRAPQLNPQGVSGGAIFYDGQVCNSERYNLAILRTAVQAGAHAANYVKAESYETVNNRVAGVLVRDTLTNTTARIQAKTILSCVGPWSAQALEALGHADSTAFGVFKAAVLVTRTIVQDEALAVKGEYQYQDKHEIVGKGYRNFFLTPWQDCTLVGTFYEHHRNAADKVSLTEAQVRAYIDQINQAAPGANLNYDDVYFSYVGLLPMAEGAGPDGEPQYRKQYALIDHAVNGHDGMISVVGVKWTTARKVALEAVNQIEQKLNRHARSSNTADQPLYGGDIENLPAFIEQAKEECPDWLVEYVLTHLIALYGSNYKAILTIARQEPALRKVLGKQTLAAQVVYAIREEAAQTLCDVLIRRTELGVAGWPGEATIRQCIALMADQLNWDEAEQQAQLEQAHQEYARRGVRHEG